MVKAVGWIVRTAALAEVVSEAVIVALIVDVVARVATAKVAVLSPAATVTDVGTEALVLDEVRLTVIPPLGAAPLRVTVPALGTPPTTVVGVRVKPVRAAEVTVRVAVVVAVPIVAVIVVGVEAATEVVVIANLAVVAPAAIDVLDGTVTTLVLADNAMTIPLAGAGPLIDTVPVDPAPPMTTAGETVNPVITGGVIVKVAVIG